MSDEFEELRRDYRAFIRERDWEQFHDPKSLILALTGEVGELAELFQWVPAADAQREFSDPARKSRAEEEMSDVLLYLLGLANALDVDLVAAAQRKLRANDARFPVKTTRSVAPRKN